MKTTFTHLNIGRQASNEAYQKVNLFSTQKIAEEYLLLKKIQTKIDHCLEQPSQCSVDAILATLSKL